MIVNILGFSWWLLVVMVDCDLVLLNFFVIFLWFDEGFVRREGSLSLCFNWIQEVVFLCIEFNFVGCCYDDYYLYGYGYFVQ